MDNKKNILIGLALACVPIPVVLYGSVLKHLHYTPSGVIVTSLILMAIPALFLILGYRYSVKTQHFTRTSFLKASAVVGIGIGLIGILPAALPLTYLVADKVPVHFPISMLVGILSFLTAWSILCASIFWGVAIAPMLKNQQQAQGEVKVAT